jgi:predicted acyl esterase
MADRSEDVIDVPTFHVIGCNDPYLHGALALYNVCDHNVATIFDHGKGHTVPRDARTVEELAVAAQRVWSGAGIRV